MFRLIISVILVFSAQALNTCDDWTQFKDTKCFKVIDGKVTEEEAIQRCQQLDRNSELVSIHSTEEQQFIVNMAANYYTVSNSVWIGLIFGQDWFKWLDNSYTNFTNWSNDAAKSGEVKCVEMSLEKDMLGKWTDVSCKKKAIAICQKKQSLSLGSLKNAIINMESKLKEMQAENDEQNKKLSVQQDELKKIVPIGFLYTQLPEQSEPNQLWPSMQWTEVTQTYAGLFFRAEGGNSSAFGVEQTESSPKLTRIKRYSNNLDKLGNNPTIDIEKGIESKKIGSGTWYGGETKALSFLVSDEEVRPTNKAVKIWKRTG